MLPKVRVSPARTTSGLGERMAQSSGDSRRAGTGSGKRRKSRYWKTGGAYCFFMTLPHAQRGFSPSALPVVSTRMEHPHAAFEQCQRSPIFITMAQAPPPNDLTVAFAKAVPTEAFNTVVRRYRTVNTKASEILARLEVKGNLEP